MKVFKNVVLAAAIATTFSANATITEISTDKFHTLFIDKTTKEVAVIGGSSMFNEAGNYAVYGQNTPVPYGVGNAVSVVATGFRSYVLKFDGTVWGSGRELGKTPVQLPLYDVSDLAATGETVLVLVDGTVYEYNIATGIQTQVEGLPTNIAEVSADFYHCVVRTVDGDVYTWGHNTQGQLGDGSTMDNPTASLIDSIPQIVHISTSRGNTVLTDVNGDVWTIGDGLSGRAGNGSDDDEVVPYNLNVSNPEQVLKAFAGYSQTFILYKDGQVEMVGWHNFIGQDENGVNLYNRSYEIVAIPELANVVTLDATGDHKMFITTDGSKIAWGSGGNGQLGNGGNIETHYPSVVQDVTFPADYVVEYEEPVVAQQCEVAEPEIVEIEVEVETIRYVEVEVEVIKEVEVITYIETIKEIEVIRYVDVPVEVTKYVDVIKEVLVEVEVIKEVIKEVVKTVIEYVYIYVPQIQEVIVEVQVDSDNGKKSDHDDNGHGNDGDHNDESNPGKKYR